MSNQRILKKIKKYISILLFSGGKQYNTRNSEQFCQQQQQQQTIPLEPTCVTPSVCFFQNLYFVICIYKQVSSFPFVQILLIFMLIISSIPFTYYVTSGRFNKRLNINNRQKKKKLLFNVNFLIIF